MIRIRKASAWATLVAGGLYAALALGQSGGPYRIAPATIAGGGGTSTGGAYRLSGTFGQPAIATLSAADYTLYDGFWGPASTTPETDLVFANGFDP
ncbi:MAG: hypothetical protein U1F23_05725 [Lysobacterales bacterium]